MSAMSGTLFPAIAYWVHLASACALTGGLAFYLLVLLPTLRDVEPDKAGAFSHLAGVRFRGLGLFLLFAILLSGLILTGHVLHAVPDRTEFFASVYGRTLGIKVALGLSAVVLGFFLGVGPVPALVSALEARDEARARAAGILIVWLSVLIFLLALGVTACVAVIRTST